MIEAPVREEELTEIVPLEHRLTPRRARRILEDNPEVTLSLGGDYTPQAPGGEVCAVGLLMTDLDCDASSVYVASYLSGVSLEYIGGLELGFEGWDDVYGRVLHNPELDLGYADGERLREEWCLQC